MKIIFPLQRTSGFLLSMCVVLSGMGAQVVTLGTDNKLRTIDSATPGTVLQTLSVSGLLPGEFLLGIDWRPATGQLYGLGISNRLYVINNSGVASQLGAAGAFTLSGTTFGFNFNPAVDRIRVVSDADQNIRLNPNDGSLTATDVALNYAGGDPHAGANPNIIGCAYANSFAGTTVTTLYGIDSALDILVVQNPPNSGILNTVGPLGVNASTVGGFDIWDFNNQAFAALAAPGAINSSLYTINLSTGAATLVGTIGGGVLVRGLAVVPTGSVRFSNTNYFTTEQSGIATITVARVGGTNGGMTVSYSTSSGTAQAGSDYISTTGFLTFTNGQVSNRFQVAIVADELPEVTETFNVALSAAPGDALLGTPTNATVQIISADPLVMYLVTVSNRLLRISTNLMVIDRTNTISGLLANEKILALDFRPANGLIYGLGSSNRLYSINETSGAATLIGGGGFTLSGSAYGFDFNPTVDRIRVAGTNRQDLRLNPNDGSLAATDVALAYGIGDPNQAVTPSVFASAYTRNFAGTLSTTLYGIDSAADVLVIQNPPNNGTLTTIGSLGVDVSAVGEFDITGTNNAAFAVMTRTSSTNSELFSINLTTGAAQSLGIIPSAESIRGLAIQDAPPRLQISRAGTNAVISWPAAAAGYVLENTPTVLPSVWTTNAAAPVLLNDFKSVTNAMAPAIRFYRLKK